MRTRNVRAEKSGLDWALLAMTDSPDGRDLRAAATGANDGMVRTPASSSRLRDVLTNVAAATRPFVPFERMGVALLEDADTVRSVLMVGEGIDQFSEHVRSRRQCSDRLW